MAIGLHTLLASLASDPVRGQVEGESECHDCSLGVDS